MVLNLSDSDRAKIDMAIEEFVRSNFRRDVRDAIEDKFGPEIAEKVHQVYEAVMACPVDWNAPGMNMDGALAVLADFLEAEFSWLSPLSRRHLNSCYIMEWK